MITPVQHAMSLRKHQLKRTSRDDAPWNKYCINDCIRMGPAMAGSGCPLESAVELTYTTPADGSRTAISGTKKDEGEPASGGNPSSDG